MEREVVLKSGSGDVPLDLTRLSLLSQEQDAHEILRSRHFFRDLNHHECHPSTPNIFQHPNTRLEGSTELPRTYQEPRSLVAWFAHDRNHG